MARTHPAVLERLHRWRVAVGEPDALLEPWLRRFRAVTDRPLRRTVLKEGAEHFDDASLIAVLHRLDERALAGGAEERWMLAELALTPSVLLELPYDRLTDLYAAARDAGYREVAARFLGARPSRLAEEPEDNPHIDLPAGQRTSAARTGDRLLMDRLLHDRDPRVIRALLDNPRLVERDVVKIASLRPTAPEVLEVIAAHDRWSQNLRVRKTLAFNPCTPTPLARQIIRTLLRQDLLALSESGLLAPDLRAELNLLLARSASRGGQPD